MQTYNLMDDDEKPGQRKPVKRLSDIVDPIREEQARKRREQMMGALNRKTASDATATDRAGKGIGDIEAMRQMVPVAARFVAENAPITGELMSMYDGAKLMKEGHPWAGGLSMAMGVLPFGAGTMRKVETEAVKKVIEDKSDDVAKTFVRQRNKSSRGEYMSPLKTEGLVGKQVYLSPDKKVGYAIDETGDLQNVFNNSKTRGAGGEAVKDAVSSGAMTLDAYDGFLPDYYKRFGFNEQARLAFDPQYAHPKIEGTPDVVFMSRAPEPDGGVPRVKDYGEGQYLARRNALQEMINGRRAPAVRTPTQRFNPEKESWGIFPPRGEDIQGTINDPRVELSQYFGKKQDTSPWVDALVNSPAVERGLLTDIERGVPTGGPEWYNPTRGIERIESVDGGVGFKDWTLMGSSSSIRNTVPNEAAVASILNMAKRQDGRLTPDMVRSLAEVVYGRERARLLQEAPGLTGKMDKMPMLDLHINSADQALRDGINLPASLTGDAWKVPSFGNARLGGGGNSRLSAAGQIYGVPIDSNVLQRWTQLGLEDPDVVAEFMRNRESAFGKIDPKKKNVVNIRNVKDYAAVSDVYNRLADKAGLPTGTAAQAAGWNGAFDATGLLTNPVGDYWHLLEEAIASSAYRRGFDTDPKSLNRYFDRVLRREDFLLPWIDRNRPLPLPPR